MKDILRLLRDSCCQGDDGGEMGIWGCDCKYNYKIGDIVCVEPFGESPTHYCKINRFKEKESSIFAMGDWYSKEGNCISGTGFAISAIRWCNPQDLFEAMEVFGLKNQNNALWYAAYDNFKANEPDKNIMDFIKEFKRLTNDGKHPSDCKCIVCL